MNPIHIFQKWYQEETEKSTATLPAACCLSSIGLDGYPNSRFVSLKEIIEDSFVITGSLSSRKGIELLHNPKASITFWWPETARQVRIQGDAFQIENELADAYFSKRNKASQLVSGLSEQGATIEHLEKLKALFEQKQLETNHTEIPRPTNWSGFYIVPKRIEFMEFELTRFHGRILFTRENDQWNKVLLQP